MSAKPGLESQERLESAALEQDGDKLAQQARMWERQGELDYSQRFRLQSLDGQKAMFQSGATERVTRTVNFADRGRSSGVSTRQMGSMLTVTPRVAGDQIILELQFEQSRPQVDNSDEPGTATPGAAAPAAAVRSVSSTSVGVQTTTTATTVSVPNGKTIVAGGLSTSNSERLTRQLILVTAKIIGPPETKQSKASK